MSAMTVKKISRKKDSRSNNASKPSEIVEIIRALQKQNGIKPGVPKRGDRIGFSFSSKDRYFFTLQALESLDTEGGFDLIWNDGSAEAAVPALAANYKFRNARLVEINRGVTGGAERAVCFGLSRLLELGYDYVGLIENDILFRAGWFRRLMEVFSRGAAEGIACGSATARSFESHVLEYRNGYAVQADIGAGMVLFSRAAAEIIMELYANPSSLQMTTHSWQKFHADLFGLDLRSFAPFWAYPPAQAFPCTLDWGYTPSLYLNGYASLSTIPSYATDLEFDVEKFFHTRYVSEEKNNTGVAYPRVASVVRATVGGRSSRLDTSLKA
ncbi:MAG TPA: hypothetical protein VNZ63_01235 [Verrucomicrobiae bacterium]|nr:hypothetical protein [Verrucomicrobiae bacterium]